MKQAFEAIFQAYEDSKVGDLRDRSGDYLAGLVLARNLVDPRILVQLLESQRDTATVLIDRENLAGDLFAFLKHLAGMADLASPGHVRDMEQAVDALFQLDERAVVGEVSDATLDDTLDRVGFANLVPRVVLSLLHTQR